MRFILLSSLTLALYAGPAAAHDFQNAPLSGGPPPVPQDRERDAEPREVRPAQLSTDASNDRERARRARDLARQYHAPAADGEEPREPTPLTISDRVIRQNAPDRRPDR